jgi:hypothetical protein
MLKNNPQASGTRTDFLASQGRVLVVRVFVGRVKSKKRPQKKFLLVAGRKKSRKIRTDELRMRTAIQRFINKMPHSTFKKLIVLTPALL